MPDRFISPTLRRSLVVAVTTAPLLLLFAGCGSSESAQVASLSSGSAQLSASTTADSSDAQLAFAKCMRENGVDMADPDPNGGFGTRGNIHLSDPKFQAGMKKCEDLIASGGDLMDRDFDSASQEKMLELAKCMRQNGVDMPDPQFDANGTMKLDSSMTGLRSNPKFSSVMKTCEQFAPNSLSGSPR